MTRKEWMEKNLPEFVSYDADGGVIGCPTSYHELVRIDPGVLTNRPCEKRHDLNESEMCELCWNMELHVQEERSKKHDS